MLNNNSNKRIMKISLTYKVLLVTVFLYPLSVDVFSQSESDTIDSPPNIIYILADDLGYGDLSCYGQTNFTTPNIDALAAQGMKFTQHYSGSTVCAPSRSALMTGLHTGHTPIRGNKEVQPEGQYPLPDEIITVAEMLKAKGYSTGVFGKWGLGYPGSEGDPLNQGFDTFFGYNCQRIAHNYYPQHLWDNRNKVMLDGNSGSKEEIYVPDLIHQKTLEYIEANRDNPFFAYVPSPLPHAELKIPDKYLKQFKGQYEPEKAYKGCDLGCEGYKQGGYGSQDTPHAAFAAMVYLLDLQVGEIVKKVKELGIERNTLIIFSSDNGPHLEGGADPDFFNGNGPFNGYKRDLYEGGIRVPMIAKWTGKITPGNITNHVSAFWDVYPTLAELVDGDTVISTDGISFLPTLLGGSQQTHDFLYWEFHANIGQSKQAVLTDGRWKAIRKLNGGKFSPIEIYDLENDSGEKYDLASSRPEKVYKARAILNKEHIDSPIEDWNFKTNSN